MSIFEFITEETTPDKAVVRKEKAWVELALVYDEAKKKGVTSKQFAEERGIKPETFQRALIRYKMQIVSARKVKELEKKPKGKLTKQDRQLLMINSFRASIRDRIRNEGAAVNNKSSKWFAETIKKGVKGHKVTRPSPGKIYTYVYDAKHKDTLPFWDRFPLIIYLGDGKGLLYGLNMHYIPPKARQQFLEELLKQYASTPVISNNTKLKIKWSNVKGFSGADKMIKSYLPAHIKGPLIEIKPDDWANVVLMPTQQFMSKGKRFSAQKVWSS